MSNKVHSQQQGSHVPFSWENKPGISKAAAVDDGHNHNHHHHRRSKLPPPPCPAGNGSRVSSHDLHIPLPPCPFQLQQPLRSSSKKGMKKMDDPFLIAYKEVTKSTKKGKGNHHQGGLGFRKNMSIFSCKKFSCSVAEGSLVKLSHLPHTRSDKERDICDD